MDPVIDGYEPLSHTDERGRTYPVYRRGTGPPVVVMHELFGISPPLLRFAARVVDRGFTVHLPSLLEPARGPGIVKLLDAGIRVCLSREFVKLATGRTSPVVGWLRSLASELHNTTGSRVGAIGLCLTGGFALAMAVDEWIAGPIVAEPSLPFPIGRKRSRDLGLSRIDLEAAKTRADLRIFGVRFSEDLMSPCLRFDRIHEEFGERFTRIDFPSGRRSPHRLSRWEHSVLTNRMFASDKANPARVELDVVVDRALDFLAGQLAQPRPSD